MDPQKRERERICAESAAMIAASRETCVDGANHVAASRRAVARSLALLGKRFFGGRDD